MSEAVARDAYCAYGVDLIRTAGLLLRTTPSTVYRASVLFLRFEASVETHFRAQYIAALDMPAYRNHLNEELKRAQLQLLSASTGSPSAAEKARDAPGTLTPPPGVEYLVPNHGQLKMPSGIAPLVDLHAPLDYCIHHLPDQDDIVYLVAACLLMAAKMEDPSTRIRAIVNICMRLTARRNRTPVNEQSKPSTPLYEDFKACVVEAEEVVLHQLGFQTYVEAPYKYVLLYLQLLVEPVGASATTVTATATATARPPAALTQWMIRAVQLINDLPRCRRLLAVPADALAVFAIMQTCPSDLTLPDKWSTAFGISERLLKAISYRYGVYRGSAAGNRRAEAALSDVRALSTVPLYRIVAERDQYNTAMAQLSLAREAADAAAIHAVNSVSPPPQQQQPSRSQETLPVSFANPASIEELRDLIGASFPSEDVRDASRRRHRHNNDKDDDDDGENILVRKSKREKRHHRHRRGGSRDADGDSRRHRHHHHRK
ncbi:hypothetical protein NESM_000318400 [Novymonas esmeraldas]|uniref:Uncharacterized protein n=1 Tax=Novymonas esmeraldas TaxID=1808958 RepID=A0AAW0EJ21_9TRYP